jgi:hypothetical protein
MRKRSIRHRDIRHRDIRHKDIRQKGKINPSTRFDSFDVTQDKYAHHRCAQGRQAHGRRVNYATSGAKVFVENGAILGGSFFGLDGDATIVHNPHKDRPQWYGIDVGVEKGRTYVSKRAGNQGETRYKRTRLSCRSQGLQ